MIHRDRLTGFTIFKDGNRKMGIADITLPDIEYQTESLKGSGIAGELDFLNPGNIGAMKMTINWRTINEDLTELSAPKAHMLECFGAIQKYDAGSGELTTQQVRLAVRCLPTKSGLGKLENGTTMDSNNEFTVAYLKMTIDGTTKFEIDPLNYIFIVDGTDYLSAARTALGLSN